MPEVTTLSVAAIRELARKRVSVTSLRAVAEEIGVSFSGLRSFLQGREPYPQTVKKLVAWFVLAREGKTPARPRKTVIRRAEVDAAVEFLRNYMAADGDERLSERRKRQLHAQLFEDGNRA
jgi:hypothetical protein